jgi:hypothetical protein
MVGQFVWATVESLSKDGNKTVGDLAATLTGNGTNTDGCLGLSALGISKVSCNMVSSFICQAKKPQIFSKNGEELPFSEELLKQAEEEML